MSSYSATRIHVMRTRLIERDQYERLLKMSDAEVINYLQGTAYREDVNAMDIKDLEDLEIVDKILAHNEERILKKLQRISKETFREVLNHHLMRNDIWNFTIAAEAVLAKESVFQSVKKYGKQGTFTLDAFTDIQTFEELGSLAQKKLPIISSATEYTAFLRELNQVTLPGTLPAERYLIDQENILELVSGKRENIDSAHILRGLQSGGTISLRRLRRAAQQDLKGAVEELRKSTYKELIDSALEDVENTNLVRFEDDLKREVSYRVRLVTRRKPLGADVLLHYLAEKAIEHNNLRLLIKGKRLGLEEQFIKEHII